jgi:hypothetical protein
VPPVARSAVCASCRLLTAPCYVQRTLMAERRTFNLVQGWIDAALRPAVVAGAILGFVGGLWIVLPCERGCWPLVGNVLAVGLYAGLGAFALYWMVALGGLAVLAVLGVISWLYHLVFHPER